MSNEFQVEDRGGLIQKTVELAAAAAATRGYFCYFSSDRTIQVVTDADAAGQATKGVFAETLSSADASRKPDRHVGVWVCGKGVIRTDVVASADVPVVGQTVYCNNNGEFCATAANNVAVGSCLAGADGQGLYTIALLVP